MTSEHEQTPDAPQAVSRRSFLTKAAGAAAVGTTLAVGIGLRELTRPEPPTHLVAHRAGTIPLDPEDRAWTRLAKWPVPMLLQNLATPFAPELVVPEISVRALHNGDQIAFHIEWEDAGEDAIDAMARFRDAVAVQLPVDPAANAAVTMGATNQPVHIMQWRAAWQADVDLGRRGVKDAFPNMYHDAPPEALMGEEAARQFYPAVVVGNPMARRDRTSPVDDLIAVGFGSLTTHEEQTANGRGVFTGKGWRVVIITPLQPGADKTRLSPGITTSIAFAVWNGGAGNRGARKQWANWSPLEIET